MRQRKLHIIRCKICHRVVRKAQPAKFCGKACKQTNYRQQKLVALEEDRKKRAEALRQMRVESEAMRQEREARALEQQEAQTKQRLEIERAEAVANEQRRRDEAAQALAEEIAATIPACPECGARHWIVARESGLFGTRHSMTCKECGKRIKPSIDPGHCGCRVNFEGYNYRYELNDQGELICTMIVGCGRIRSWGEWKLQAARC